MTMPDQGRDSDGFSTRIVALALENENERFVCAPCQQLDALSTLLLHKFSPFQLFTTHFWFQYFGSRIMVSFSALSLKLLLAVAVGPAPIFADEQTEARYLEEQTIEDPVDVPHMGKRNNWYGDKSRINNDVRDKGNRKSSEKNRLRTNRRLAPKTAKPKARKGETSMPSVSAAPSIEPSRSPSNLPSTSPSTEPSDVPSSLPSWIPSNDPSSMPSVSAAPSVGQHP